MCVCVCVEGMNKKICSRKFILNVFLIRLYFSLGDEKLYLFHSQGLAVNVLLAYSLFRRAAKKSINFISTVCSRETFPYSPCMKIQFSGRIIKCASFFLVHSGFIHFLTLFLFNWRQEKMCKKHKSFWFLAKYNLHKLSTCCAIRTYVAQVWQFFTFLS